MTSEWPEFRNWIFEIAAVSDSTDYAGDGTYSTDEGDSSDAYDSEYQNEEIESFREDIDDIYNDCSNDESAETSVCEVVSDETDDPIEDSESGVSENAEFERDNDADDNEYVENNDDESDDTYGDQEGTSEDDNTDK